LPAALKRRAVAVFGKVVALRENLNWYENRPLSGETDRSLREHENKQRA
jgi:hypothetical protein